MAVDKAKSTLKEISISMLAIVISIVIAVFALGVANWLWMFLTSLAI